MGRTLELVVGMPDMPPGWPPLPPGEFLAHILAHVEDDGTLYVAPVGSPTFPGPTHTDPLTGVVSHPAWIRLGPLDDLPMIGPLGGVRSAYWAAVMDGGCLWQRVM